jgi:hypothetical protein
MGFNYLSTVPAFSDRPLLCGEAKNLFTLSPGEEEELLADSYERRELKRVGAKEGLIPALWVCKGDRRARRRGRKVYEYLGHLFGTQVFTSLFQPGGDYPSRLHERWDLQRIRYGKLREDPSTAIWRLYQRKAAGCRIARMILWKEARHRAGPFYGQDWDGDISELADAGSWMNYLWETFPEEPPLGPEEAQEFWEWWAREILPLHPSKKSWGYVYVYED